MPVDTSTGKEEIVHSVDLSPSSAEYKEVLTAFEMTMGSGSITHTAPVPQGISQYYQPSLQYSRVVQIQRIQNPGLYATYQAKLKDMNDHNPPTVTNEHRLFHGTQPNTCDKINKQGYNRSYAGMNGALGITACCIHILTLIFFTAAVIGKGVYFACDASYSARPTYSPPDPQGHKYMYYARVLTGEFTRGSSGLIVPPPKNPQKDPNIPFDSVVDNVANPSVFVIFNDTQAYPEYLIQFT